MQTIRKQTSSVHLLSPSSLQRAKMFCYTLNGPQSNNIEKTEMPNISRSTSVKAVHLGVPDREHKKYHR